MRLFIKDCLEGKHSDLICLLTYLAEPVSTKDLRSIAATLGWSTRELNAATDFLTYAEIIETRWISYSDRSYGIEPDFFFHAATSFIKTRGDLLNKYCKLFPHRSGNAEFLWAVAKALYKGETDIASKISGSFPPGKGGDYIRLANDNGALNGYALKFDAAEFSNYLLERVRSHVLFDNHDPAILENLLSLATEYSRKGAEKKHFDYNLLFNRIQVEYFLCTGKVIDSPIPTGELYSTPAIEAVKALYAGEYDKASKLFAESLKRRNTRFADKNVFSDPLLSFFLIISYKLSDTDKDLTKVSQFPGKRIVKEAAQLYPSVLAARFLGEPEEPSLELLHQRDLRPHAGHGQVGPGS